MQLSRKCLSICLFFLAQSDFRASDSLHNGSERGERDQIREHFHEECRGRIFPQRFEAHPAQKMKQNETKRNEEKKVLWGIFSPNRPFDQTGGTQT